MGGWLLRVERTWIGLGFVVGLLSDESLHVVFVRVWNGTVGTGQAAVLGSLDRRGRLGLGLDPWVFAVA